jgi:tRNA G18 (ribose-2'-O)-methylase SpoU
MPSIGLRLKNNPQAIHSFRFALAAALRCNRTVFEVQQLESFDDPGLTPYRTMRRQYDHWEQEIFVAEGAKVVQRLLESSISVISVLMPEAALAHFEPLLRKRGEQIAVFTAPKPMLEELTGFSMYQGILALAKVPGPFTLGELLAMPAKPRLFIALDGLSNAENLGVIIRNAVAFGAQALILNETCAPPYLRRAVRNSMGTVFKLPYLRSAALPTTLRELQKAGVAVVAAHPHTERRLIFEADFSGDCCVVFGSEGDGISPAVLAACSQTVAIPMHFGTDSLNVASATAVFLYEVQRQRWIA